MLSLSWTSFSYLMKSYFSMSIHNNQSSIRTFVSAVILIEVFNEMLLVIQKHFSLIKGWLLEEALMRRYLNVLPVELSKYLLRNYLKHLLIHSYENHFCGLIIEVKQYSGGELTKIWLITLNKFVCFSQCKTVNDKMREYIAWWRTFLKMMPLPQLLDIKRNISYLQIINSNYNCKYIDAHYNV